MKDPNIRRYTNFPKTLGQCVEPVTRPVFKAKGLAGTKLLTEWAQVVGAKLASHSAPEKIAFPQGKKTEGTLTIAVENGFATEIQHMQPIILERMTSYFGYKAIARIAISHAYLPPPVVEAAVTKQAKPSLPGGSEKLAEGVVDEELKAALESFARTLSQQPT